MALKPIGAMLAGTLLQGGLPAPPTAAEAQNSARATPIAVAAAHGAVPAHSDEEADQAFAASVKSTKQCKGNCADCPMKAVELT